MAIIITYDIPSKHVEFKKAMFLLGYKDQIEHSAKIIYLPNTTLYHQTKTSEVAIDEAKNICTKLNIKLERCVATQFGPSWAAIWGEPFK